MVSFREGKRSVQVAQLDLSHGLDDSKTWFSYETALLNFIHILHQENQRQATAQSSEIPGRVHSHLICLPAAPQPLGTLVPSSPVTLHSGWVTGRQFDASFPSQPGTGSLHPRSSNQYQTYLRGHAAEAAPPEPCPGTQACCSGSCASRSEQAFLEVPCLALAPLCSPTPERKATGLSPC